MTRDDFNTAVAAYWDAKFSQNELSSIKNKVGEGTAGSVRAGKHFDSIAGLIAKFFLEAGYPPASIRLSIGDRLEVPGYYRPQKRWDVVVTHDNVLVAAFELKALGGPSYGNNYNNRVEEALGSAVDVRKAATEKRFTGEKPWLGYFFIMEDGKGSRSPVKLDRGAFDVEPIWEGSSYQKRFGVFCERLVAEGLYDAACYIISSANSPEPVEPIRSLDWQHFAAAITARITFLRELGIPKPSEESTLF